MVPMPDDSPRLTPVALATFEALRCRVGDPPRPDTDSASDKELLTGGMQLTSHDPRRAGRTEEVERRELSL